VKATEAKFIEFLKKSSQLVILISTACRLDRPRVPTAVGRPARSEGLGQGRDQRRALGNGDVEVSLSKPEELPYVVGLVRQAFEKQMGDGEAEA
jgi:hypothetical protein